MGWGQRNELAAMTTPLSLQEGGRSSEGRGREVPRSVREERKGEETDRSLTCGCVACFPAEMSLSPQLAPWARL